MNMRLIRPKDNHIVEMMTWFSDERELTDWAGPNFRYPYTLSSFIEDSKVKVLSSFSLVSNESDFLAFGQYYNRLDKCHLGRLIVSPRLRGKGVASELMLRLCEFGIKDLNVNQCSLFVLKHNKKAIKAYEKFGFSFVDYPGEIPLEGCLYMVK